MRNCKLEGDVWHIGAGTLSIMFVFAMILLYFVSPSTFWTILRVLRTLFSALTGS